MKTLREIYKNHSGKVSDKWDIYLDTYDQKFSTLKKSPIKLFEIGVLNGGSLQIFSQYFENAKLILGCDIDKKCEKLKYTEKNIKLIVGDVNSDEISDQIIKNGDFDIIIDDGSHTSKDIVTSFCKYFKHLKYDGIYIAEDLHASYQKEHGGGLFYPISSMNFFKKLVDIINFEHWGINKEKNFIRFVKAFVYLVDIDKGYGEHEVCIRSHKSLPLNLRTIQRHQYSRLKESLPHFELKSIVGKAGYSWIEDTTTFHRGTVPRIGDRLMLSLSFNDKKSATHVYDEGYHPFN